MKFRWVLATCALAMMSAAALAQPGGGNRFGGGGAGGGGISSLVLLRIEAVQKELELVDDQIEAIDKLAEEMRGGFSQFGDRSRQGPRDQQGRAEGDRRGRDGDRRDGDRRSRDGDRPDSSRIGGSADIFFVQQRDEERETERPQRRPGVFGNLSDEERQKRIDDFRKQMEDRQKTIDSKLAEILLPHQLDRLKQIQLQVMGVRALQQPEIAKQLKITEKQQKEMEQVRENIGDEMRANMREIFQSGDRDKIREKFSEIRKQAEEKMLGVLNKEQREQFKKMQGEKFELPENAMGSMFGGRGGGPPAAQGRGVFRGNFRGNRGDRPESSGDQPDA